MSDQSLTLGAVLHAARRRLDLSLREVEEKTRRLELQQADLYGVVNRMMVSRLEERDNRFFLDQSPRVTRAVIVALYGTLEAFITEADYDPHLSPSQAVSTPRTIPLWNEGERGIGRVELTTVEGGSEQVSIEDNTSMFAVRVTRQEMTPKLFPTQIVSFNPHQRVQVGRLVAVQRNGELQLAFALTDGMFSTIHGVPFTGKNVEVLGVAAADVLHIPAAQLKIHNMPATG